MKQIGLSELIYVELGAIIILSLILLIGLAESPAPISHPPAVSALDFWFQRYQTLIAALIALAAGLSAYAVARINHKYEEETKRQEELSELIRCFRTCVLDISRINTRIGILLQESVKSGNRSLLVDAEKQRSLSESKSPEWLNQTASKIPLVYAKSIHQYYLSIQQATEIIFDFEDATKQGTVANTLCREYLLAASIIEGILYSTLAKLEQVGSLEIGGASSARVGRWPSQKLRRYGE